MSSEAFRSLFPALHAHVAGWAEPFPIRRFCEHAGVSGLRAAYDAMSMLPGAEDCFLALRGLRTMHCLGADVLGVNEVIEDGVNGFLAASPTEDEFKTALRRISACDAQTVQRILL